ncbi:MAG: transglutaminase family protein [Gammaproteobacteria bacterium]|jgi:transglutaminase-like putative cysteine protease
MNYKITHTTTYQYSKPVSVCHNEARFKPLSTFYQRCLESQVIIDPPPADYRERTDFFGNQVAYFAIQEAHRTLRVTAVSTVKTLPEGRDPGSYSNLTWQHIAQSLIDGRDGDILDARQYKLNSPLIIVNQELASYAERSFLSHSLIVDAVQDLMERIHRDFTYDPHFTTIATPILEVLKHRRGVCQDFAHLAIACIRSMGLAARYVSGYIETRPPKGQQRLIGADASHAWFSVYVPKMGWIDFDPTNNQMPMDRHVTVAVGRDYRDVTPLKGIIFGGGKHKLDVAVDVENMDAASTEFNPNA